MLPGVQDEGQEHESRAGFATTRWSLVRRARREGDQAAREALAELCSLYWAPVHRYIRRRGHDEEQARDHTQAFFTSLIEGGHFDAVDASRGRFRAWLLGCAKHFLSNAAARSRTWKRGGAQQLLSLDFDAQSELPLADERALDPEAAFAREWTLALLQRVLQELESEYTSAGQAELFGALRSRLLPGGEEPAFQQLAERFGRSAGSLKTAAHRLRRRYAELLRRQVADTLEDQSELEDELRGLFESVSKPA